MKINSNSPGNIPQNVRPANRQLEILINKISKVFCPFHLETKTKDISTVSSIPEIAKKTDNLVRNRKAL